MQNINIFCYADDITITSTASNESQAKHYMQTYLNSLVRYIETWGLLINPKKTKMQIFHKQRKRKDCTLKIHGKTLPNVSTKKLLGVIIDAPKLTYTPHLQTTVLNIRKRIDVMKYLSSTHWGASQKVLKCFYLAFIRSKLEYGSLIYSSTSKTNLNKLDVLQNKALRLILGGRNTSPISSLEVLADIPPLEIRRDFLKSQFYLKQLYKPLNDKTAITLEISNSNDIPDESQIIPNSLTGNIKKLMSYFYFY